MRVVDQQRWQRAKVLCAVLLTLFLLWCSKGVNNDIQSNRLAMAWLVLPFWVVLVLSINKNKRNN